MIKEGESVREPGVRRKPVLSSLPPGITMDQIRAEMITLLMKDAVVNVEIERTSKQEWALPGITLGSSKKE